jgi:hypothetical protein
MNRPKFGIGESPQRIKPPNPELGFDVDRNNRELASEILRSNRASVVHTTQMGNLLYKYGNRFILVDPHQAVVLYYMKWTDEYYSLLGTTVTREVLHWRNRGVFESRNLTSQVFFDLLLPIHGCVMTDIVHTEPGEGFWLRMIDEAFDRGLYIYNIDFLQGKMRSTPEVKLLANKMEFHSLLIMNSAAQSPWGGEHKFNARRIVISNRILKRTV